MDLHSKINQDLRISQRHVRVQRENIALCLVHERWIQNLTCGKWNDNHFIEHDTYTDEECSYLLAQPVNLHPPWKFVSVQYIPKLPGQVARFPRALYQPKDLSKQDLSYSQLLHYITDTNFKNLWKEARKKYSHSNIQDHREDLHYKVQEYNEAVRESLHRLYNCPFVSVTGESRKCEEYVAENVVHDNVLPAYCVLESSSAFYVFQPHLQYTLHDSLTFSPAILGSSYCKPLFVVYQILQALRDFHNRGLFSGDLSLRDICLDQNLWVQIRPRLWDSLAREIGSTDSLSRENRSKFLAREDNFGHECASSSNTCRCFYYKTGDRFNKDVSSYLNSLVEDWMNGEISNFDYLMELNYLAGRRVGNPNHHPVLPWVIDFASPSGNWRDLGKSKYRLNKGDRQLDMTYESLPAANNSMIESPQVPHHISDVLTDITFYVYMARRIPQSVLCQHVRSNWVPAEYPSSMQRMQEWTPDECIPEFYSDPQVFKSIHEDLQDLDLPKWARDPEDFISKHRAALESDHVSERLHSWIDLTFGYRLSGNAAVKSKNVCLHLVDHHTVLVSSGVVQLFQHPHPHKLASSPFLTKHPPKLHRLLSLKETQKRDKISEEGTDSNKENEDDSSLSDHSGRMFTKQKSFKGTKSVSTYDIRGDSRSDSQIISLPRDYNPLASLNQLESLGNFTAKTTRKVFRKCENVTSGGPHSLHQRKMRDMIALGCIVVEIFLAPRLRTLSQLSSLGERYELIRKMLKTDFYELPRCVRHVVKLLLQLEVTDLPAASEGGLSLPQRYPALTAEGLPPLSAHQLLQPLVQLFPFPPYFEELYYFLCEIKRLKDEIHSTHDKQIIKKDRQITDEEVCELVNHFSESLVKKTAKDLPKLLPTLTPEATDIIVLYLQEMFDDNQTSVLAAWYLFDPVAQILGPQETKKRLLLPLIRLYDSEVYTVKTIKLFHRSYLLQLIVRLGLQTFLTHFVTRLIEAVGGYKDDISDNPQRTENEKIRKTSHLHSPDIEDPRDMYEVTLSPFDEDSLQAEPEVDTTVTTITTTSTNVTMKSQDKEEGGDSKDAESEPEIFVFEVAAEDLNTESTDVDLIDHLEQKLAESSDSADAVSIGDGSGDAGRSPILEDPFPSSSSCPRADSVEAAEANSGSVSSLPRMFGTTMQQQGTVYSTSVPNFVCSSPNQGELEMPPEEEGPVKKSPGSPPSSKSDKSRPCQEYNISDVAMESISWLAHRLGPVLTAKHLSRNLLRMLGLCYYGKEQLMFSQSVIQDGADQSVSIANRSVVGDGNVSKVIGCLSSIAALYGEHFILLQYMPHISDLVTSCKRRITPNTEASLIGSMMLLKHIIPYLSDTTLMDHLQDTLIRDILYPTVRLISSVRLSFPNGGHARQVVAYKLLDVLYLIGLRIGFEMTRKHLTSVLCRFFASFDRVYYPNKNLDVSSEFKVSSSKSPDDTYLTIIKKTEGSNEYTIGSPVSMSALKESYGSLTPPCSLTSNKDNVGGDKWDSMDELRQMFTPEMAYTAYVPFCRLAGGIHMEQSLRNDELIRRLCMDYDEMTAKSCRSDTRSTFEETSRESNASFDSSWNEDEHIVSGTFGKNVAMVGNRIDIKLDDETVAASEVPILSNPSGETSKVAELPKCDLSKLISKKMENNQRHLRGTWLAYWEHEIGRSDKDVRFNFKQIKLQTFYGHASAVRSIHCLDNENSFISASKDKTVKLWSLRSHGDGSAHSSCQWTYSNHKKSVFAVTFLESMRLAASCDNTVHLWDPFMGSCIKQFDSTKNSPVVVLTSMPTPSPVLITGTNEATIRFLDARLLKYVHEYKVSVGPAGVIRCITVSPDGHWLAVGHSSGVISVLDVRTGLMTGSWKGHEGEILQIKAYNHGTFVTSSLDHCVSVWNADDGKMQGYLRGPTEPVNCLNFYRNEMISATTANRIGVHTSVDNQASFSSTRLRSETFKGVIGSLTVLPLNRLLLLGADSGLIRLLC